MSRRVGGGHPLVASCDRGSPVLLATRSPRGSREGLCHWGQEAATIPPKPFAWGTLSGQCRGQGVWVRGSGDCRKGQGTLAFFPATGAVLSFSPRQYRSGLPRRPAGRGSVNIVIMICVLGEKHMQPQGVFKAGPMTALLYTAQALLFAFIVHIRYIAQ